MIEKDTIKELFSKSFENQTASVNPELWSGIQSKMAAAGVVSTSTVATKGLSALTKWIIGSAAVGTVGVVTAFIALNSSTEENNSIKPQQTENKTLVSKSEQVNSVLVVSPDGELKTSKEKSSVQEAVGSTDEPVISRQDELEVSPNETEKESMIPGTLTPKNVEPKKIEEDKIKPVTPAPKEINTDKTSAPVLLEAKVTHFPNVFTPNGDGLNDTYKVSVENILSYRIVIIDQKNRVVFESTDLNVAWDGTFNGDKAESGSYAAIVTGKDAKGKSFKDIQLFDLVR